MKLWRVSLILLLSSWHAHASDSDFNGDSGILGPPYRQLISSLELLAQANPDFIKVIRYGRSVHGRDLAVLRISDEAVKIKATFPKPAILVTEATHGNEYLHLVDRMPKELVDHRGKHFGARKFFELGGIVYVVPVMNPDGYDMRYRENGNGEDLNRDFPIEREGKPGFLQPETKAFVDFLRQDLAASNASLRVSIDYHCCAAALLYPWSYTDEPIVREDLQAHRYFGHKMVEIFGQHYQYGTTSEVLGYKPWGTSKDFYFAEFEALSFTFEGRYRLEEDRFPQHLRWWDSILATVAGY